MKFEFRFNRSGQLDHHVIEYRRPNFEGVGHAHAINLHQDIAGQVRFQVCVTENAMLDLCL